MNIIAKTYNQPQTLQIDVHTASPQKIWLKVEDRNKPFTFYTDRYTTVNGTESFFVRMPQSPEETKIMIYNEENGNLGKGEDNTFEIGAMKRHPLKTKLNHGAFQNDTVKNFIAFAKEFSEEAGILSAGRSIYTSDDGMFRIDYLNEIRNRQGMLITTPARINQKTGVIQVNKSIFKKYTVPMRLAILLHEFSHFYLNKDKNSESEADLNALLVYLGLGYPRIDAYNVFLNVFKKAPTEQNKERYDKINKFIQNFDYTNYYVEGNPFALYKNM